jgi:hypothetical protein
MKKRYLFFLFYCLSISSLSFTQENDTTEFKPHGKPIIRIFANFHTGLNENSEFTGFDVSRAYLGYEYHLSENFSGIVKLDIGSPDDVSLYSKVKRYAYFKNAAIVYRYNNLTVHGGIIDMQHFIYQEKFWGYRYIAKSFSDRYRFGPKADIGVDVVYKFGDFLSVDLSFMNGEGYTNLQRDDTYKGGLGFTVFPIKGLSLRGYADLMEKGEAQITLASFIGYKFKKLFRVAIEYNHKLNDNFAKNQDRYGISTYGTVHIFKKFEVFGRYDWIVSNVMPDEINPWNLPYDGSSVIAGVQYAPIKKVKLSLNYQDWVPYAQNENNSAFVFVNVEFKY